VIPTVLVLGLVSGLLSLRFGWLFIPLAALAWAVALAQAGVCAGSCTSDALFLAAVNAAVGVAIGSVLRWSLNGFRFAPPSR
jgi:hypothetical protein